MLAPVITDGRTDERTDIPFFLPFPKTNPLVPRGNKDTIGSAEGICCVD